MQNCSIEGKPNSLEKIANNTAVQINSYASLKNIVYKRGGHIVRRKLICQKGYKGEQPK